MKRLLFVTLVVGLLVLGSTLTALAEGNGPAPGSSCGEYFGQHHADHAQDGYLGKQHNPGNHQGLANFLDHGDHTHECP